MIFITKVKKVGEQSVDLDTIERMVRYQSELIGYMLYEPKCPSEGIINEVRAVESWLQDKAKGFTHDNNRKLVS